MRLKKQMQALKLQRTSMAITDRSRLRLGLTLASAALCAAGCAPCIAANTATTSSAKKPAASAARPPAGLTPDELVSTTVYRSANKAVVNISSVSAPEDAYFNVVPREGCGSGTIISPEGYVLTNNHVVEGARAIRVTLWDGTALPTEVVGTDPDMDLAVIKITPPPGKKLTVVPFGDSSRLEVGRRVFAIGNPFGLDRTLTQGIISSVGRTLRTDSGRLIKGVIQTDAAINPGNSGGPLLDTQGRLIGINTAIWSKTGQSSGIGLAIPINIAKRIVPQLITHHRVIRPEIGIMVVQPVESGLRIMRLDPNGPAARAGVAGPKLIVHRDGPFIFQSIDAHSADILTSIDETPVKSADDLLSYLEQKKPGQVVTLTILRHGHMVKIPVKLTVVGPA